MISGVIPVALRQAASRAAATAMRIVSQPSTTAAVARANPCSPVREEAPADVTKALRECSPA